jgi:hypothetical protein
MKQRSSRKNDSKVTKKHKNPSNVVTVHVVSEVEDARRRKKRQHPRSYSNRKFKSHVTEEKAARSDKTSNQECIEYVPESGTKSEESISDNASTSESSDNLPLLVLTSPQDRNEMYRSKNVEITGPAGSQTSDHPTAVRTSSQNISEIHSDSSQTDSHSSSTGVCSHEESSSSTEFHTPPPSFKQTDCTGTTPNLCVMQYHQHGRDNTQGTGIPPHGDNGFQHHGRQAHTPHRQLSYHTDSLGNYEHEAYFTASSESDDECQKGYAEFA